MKSALQTAEEMAEENLKRYNLASRQYHLTGRKTCYQADHLRLDARHLVILMEQYLDAANLVKRLKAVRDWRASAS
jgi:hypothetical protein